MAGLENGHVSMTTAEGQQSEEWIYCRPLARTSMVQGTNHASTNSTWTVGRRQYHGPSAVVYYMQWPYYKHFPSTSSPGVCEVQMPQNQSNSAARMLRYADAPPHHRHYYAKGSSLVSLYLNLEVFRLGSVDLIGVGGHSSVGRATSEP